MQNQNTDQLMTHHFSDQSSLLWSKPQQHFIYLNPISTWIRTSLEHGVSKSEVVQMLVDETKTEHSESVSLVNSVAGIDSNTESNLPEVAQNAVVEPTTEHSAEIPFEEYIPDFATQSHATDSTQIKTGGVVIEIVYRDASIDFSSGMDFFSHLVLSEKSENPEYSINIGKLNDSRFWINSTVTKGYVATTVEALSSLLYWMIYKTVAASEDWLINLHAGGVAVSENNALIVCGPSGSGKSTLTAALISRFKTYISDEIIPVTRNSHQIYSVGTSVCVKENSWATTSSIHPELKNVHSIERLGKQIKFLPIGPDIKIPATIGGDEFFILFPEYNLHLQRPASSRHLTSVEVLDNFLGSGALIGELNTQTQFDDFCSWLETVNGYALTYRSTDQALDLISAILTDGESRRVIT